jgi:protein gp37
MATGAVENWTPLAGDGSVLRDVIGVPARWERRRVVAVAPGADLFAPEVPTGSIEAIVAAVRATPRHAYVLTTRRTKRLLALANDGFPLPANLWLGAGVEADDQVWRAEDLLRCNTASAWVRVEPMLGPLPSLPVDMLAWVVCAAPAAGAAGLVWVRGLRDRCVAAGVAFCYRGGGLDGRLWDQCPEGLRLDGPAAGRPWQRPMRWEAS